MLDWKGRQEAVAKACEEFPGEFGLRGFPGKTFRVSESSSYWDGDVMIYTQLLCDDGVWKDFAKGTPSELRAQMVRL